MRLTILGTGTARPVGDSPQSGVLVEAGDAIVLFDIGSGIASQVEKRMNAADLSALFVGHFHADHWIDIGPLRYRFPWGEPAPRPLPLYLPPGGRDKLNHLAAAIAERPSFFEPAYAITEYETGQVFQVGPLRIVPHAVGHYVPAWSMEITGPAGERVVYAGDMGPSEMVVELARDAELLILEATLESGSTDDARRGHIDTAEAIDHVRRSNARQGVLVHYHSERRALIAAQCAASGVPVEPAVSGMIIDVEPGSVRISGPRASYETVRTG
ncbi:MAG TPA: MBL fold metallo-hydrolase [Candidatus Dormibacteraeota bacterium]|nr:MBL fold metallo-hydrolase [Candidatus Dormibacteraeota bacterium]